MGLTMGRSYPPHQPAAKAETGHKRTSTSDRYQPIAAGPAIGTIKCQILLGSLLGHTLYASLIKAKGMAL